MNDRGVSRRNHSLTCNNLTANKSVSAVSKRVAKNKVEDKYYFDKQNEKYKNWYPIK